MTSAELDNEFRELNAAQMRVNTRAAVEQIVGARVSGKKEVQKSGAPGLKMMRAEEEVRDDGLLSPVTEILNTRNIYPQRTPWYLRSKISTIKMTIRRTAQNILTRSIRTAPAVNPQT